MKIFVATLLTLSSLFASAQYPINTNEKKKDCYVNPIFRGDYPDPSILRDGSDYYIVHSSFDYYPGLMIWHSKDLINWTPVTNALYKNVGSVWAPDLVKHKNKYYILPGKQYQLRYHSQFNSRSVE
jgi:xylan 1,4-beta-xylosidase